MKRSMTLISLAVALGLASSSVYADNSWEKEAKDAWIDGKAEATLLFNGNLDSFDINTDVKNGEVRLTGQVESDVEKELAEELIVSIDGVTSVDNRLSVASDDEDNTSEFMQDLSDQKVETVVKTRLLFESEVSGSDIEVEAENGIVTLKGEVDSDAERDLAVTIAKNTDDVSKVVDKLSVTG
ncbi:BON domain-containing protein [Aestuariibacter sp. AA17]|uniref:BON domain-containing protein n=1 Tax=Fluctibacter corallii TaxID=2984329 RepID=A0ABT3A590_9ALTE|nr:BON domain-containing protein [Aestuariibacter sp. AA17]MCV2883830.1 BON domain-containing protein [Aestuariibacter sp. AA17]